MNDAAYLLTALTSDIFLGILILICVWGFLYSIYKKRWGIATISFTALLILLFILWNCVLYIKSGFDG